MTRQPKREFQFQPIDTSKPKGKQVAGAPRWFTIEEAHRANERNEQEGRPIRFELVVNDGDAGARGRDRVR